MSQETYGWIVIAGICLAFAVGLWAGIELFKKMYWKKDAE